jgi:LacI family transcriptional regulator
MISRKSRASQFDVAKECGVSQSVVSAVFANSSTILVNENTRKRVLEAAEKLGYTKRFLNANQWGHIKSGTIAWIDARRPIERGPSEPITRSYETRAQELLSSVVARLNQEDYSLVVKHHSPGSRTKDWLLHKTVEGIIWQGSNKEDPLFTWLINEFPVVVMNRSLNRTVDRVTVNQEENISIPFEYLHSLGHRRIGYYGHVPGDELFGARCISYRVLCEKYGLRYYQEFLDISDSPEIGSAVKAKAILDCWTSLKPEAPTALIMSDFHALHLLQECHRREIRVPEELSLIGVDDIDACMFSNPALTSVHQPYEEVGRTATELLLARIAEPNRSRRTELVTPYLVKRGSVGEVPLQAETGEKAPRRRRKLSKMEA